MNKEARLEMIKNRFRKLKEAELFIGIPMTKRDIKETVEELDSFQEHQRDKKSNQMALTSDEGHL